MEAKVRYTLPPHKTKSRITTNFKTKNNQNCEKTVWTSKNQGVEEETFIQTSRRGGEGHPGQRRPATRQQLVNQGKEDGDWCVRHSHICLWMEEQLRSKTDCATQDSSVGKESLKTSGKNL